MFYNNFDGVYKFPWYNFADLQFYKVSERLLYFYVYGRKNAALKIFYAFLVYLLFIIINKNCLSFEEIFYLKNISF